MQGWVALVILLVAAFACSTAIVWMVKQLFGRRDGFHSL
jgi:hypothetical protein